MSEAELDAFEKRIAAASPAAKEAAEMCVEPFREVLGLTSVQFALLVAPITFALDRFFENGVRAAGGAVVPDGAVEDPVLAVGLAFERIPPDCFLLAMAETPRGWRVTIADKIAEEDWTGEGPTAAAAIDGAVLRHKEARESRQKGKS